MSNIHAELQKISPDLLQKMFEFAGHAMNNYVVIADVCKERNIPIKEGLAYGRTFIDIGIGNRAEILYMSDFQSLEKQIDDLIWDINQAFSD